jgi:2Fe-2S ferredoxin
MQTTEYTEGTENGADMAHTEESEAGTVTVAPPGENTVRVTFLPEGKTVEFEHDKLPYKDHGKKQSLLDVALNNGIRLDHACGGNCACTTCHVWVKEGAENLSEMDDDEADRLDMAADLQLNSRLGCQAVIKKPGKVVVEIPAWNRNYVSEEH